MRDDNNDIPTTKHNRTMDSFLKKWLSTIAGALTLSFLAGIVTFIQMGSAVAENAKDIKAVMDKTEIVTELRIKQANLIDSVKDNTTLIRENAKVLQQILREVKK